MRWSKFPIAGGTLAVIVSMLGLECFLWQRQLGGLVRHIVSGTTSLTTGVDISAKRQGLGVSSPTPVQAWSEYRYLYHGLDFQLRYPPNWIAHDAGEIGVAFGRLSLNTQKLMSVLRINRSCPTRASTFPATWK